MARLQQTFGSIALLLFLWLSCIGSALCVVYSSYASRQATQSLESLRRQAAGLQVRSGQYLLEKSSWAAYSRVEKIAREKLAMTAPLSDKTVLIYR